MVYSIISYNLMNMLQIKDPHTMERFGEKIGKQLRGGEVIELIGDVGAGKTTFVRGLARGMGISEAIASPSFTISRMYDGRRRMMLAHYDFYRLQEPGILALELNEAINNRDTVVVVEWARTVQHILPTDRIVLHILSPTENARSVEISGGGSFSFDLDEI